MSHSVPDYTVCITHGVGRYMLHHFVLYTALVHTEARIRPKPVSRRTRRPLGLISSCLFSPKSRFIDCSYSVWRVLQVNPFPSPPHPSTHTPHSLLPHPPPSPPHPLLLWYGWQQFRTRRFTFHYRRLVQGSNFMQGLGSRGKLGFDPIVENRV